MALTEKEAAIIKSAIEDVKKNASEIAQSVREQARQIGNLGQRLQKMQENMQTVMASYRPSPVNEMNEIIDEARKKINELSKLAKTLKG